MSKNWTKGEWFCVETSFGNIKSATVSYPHGFFASANVIPTCDNRLDGESWLEMRGRTKSERREKEKESIANMHLISAAPELYDALEVVHSLISEGAKEGCNPLEGDGEDKLCKSQGKTFAALRKARGET